MAGSGSTGDDGGVVDRVRRALAASGPSHREIADAEVAWVGTNGARIDVRLRDGTGREHHVVAIEDGSEVAVGLVLTEPDDLGPQAPVVVVVNGPSGSGKSSLMQAIAARDSRPWIVFDEPIIGTTDQRLLVWKARAQHVHEGFIRGIAATAATGNAVAVSAGGHRQQVFQEAFGGMSALYVGLDCPLETLLERERGREDRWGGLAMQSIDDHDGWSYDLRIDTSVVWPTEGADLVLHRLGGRADR